METKSKKLLKILSDGHVHSGEVLGKKLEVTRAGIWKLMQQLKAWNIDVVAKTNQGYCIPGGMELLEKKKILEAGITRDTRLIHPSLKIFDVLPSTNTYLLERARAGQKDVRICLAEHQSRGRGRFGRHWVSAYGKNMYCSLLWTFTCDLSQLAGLSLVVGIAMARALKKYGIKEIALKWPNDVLWRGKKLAGILIELNAESHHTCDAVIGIGLNGALSPALQKQAKKALVDIHEITGEAFKRNVFIASLLKEIFAVLTLFQTEGLAPFIGEWRAYDVAMDKSVTLLLGNQTIQGTYRGIDPRRGDLILEETGGKYRHYSSGEVSLTQIFHQLREQKMQKTIYPNNLKILANLVS